MAFLDLKKKYNGLDRECLWMFEECLIRIYGINGKIMASVMSFYYDSKACVRVNGKLA